jgi:hypothetical protein
MNAMFNMAGSFAQAAAAAHAPPPQRVSAANDDDGPRIEEL